MTPSWSGWPTPSGRVAKAASRDLGPLVASRALASTTVSATLRIAHLAGIGIAATGGIGGVHRGASTSFDISGDIDELAVTPLAIVSSGAKSILDLPATLELLETRRIPVIGYGVDELPSFYSVRSGLRLTHRVDTAVEAADAIAAHRSVAGSGGILVAQPPPARPRARPGRRRALDRRGPGQREGPGRRRRCGHAPPARASRSCVGGPNARGERGADRGERAHRRADRCRGIGGRAGSVLT